MPIKLTKLEKAWVLYDVGNSAFILLVSTIIPIYFNYLAGLEGMSSVNYLAYWGYAASISTLLVAIIGPICGALADNKNFKKPIFIGALLIGALSCVLLGIASSWLAFLVIFIIAKTGYSSSIVFYDAMLTDVTTEERMDHVSTQGFAWGYIGSCIPFGIGFMLVLGADKIGLSMQQAMAITFGIVAIWWIGVTLPLLKNYKQKYYVEVENGCISKSFLRLGITLKSIKKDKKLLFFLLAFFFYIDGVYTIIEMATAYGQALGLDSTGLLMALLVTQIVAFPCAILFGRLTKRFHTEKLITVCILAYIGIAIFALFMTSQLHFWILAICVGLFQGGIQALSRSYFAKIIPAEKSGEYFGILDICGKGASFMGTTVVGIASQLSGNVNIGVSMLTVIFIIGLLLFRKAIAVGEEGMKTDASYEC